MLLNQNFLFNLDQQQNIEKFARVTLLSKEELPIEQIEGRLTNSGSINIDGNSAIRRSCSLTMVVDNANYHDYLWTVKSKFKLEIGIKNHVDRNYPDIIWFPQGIYVFTSFSTNHATNNFTISLQGKDKGCLINGEFGGVFNSSIDLGTIEIIDKNNNSTIEKIEIREIIFNLMHQYVGEPFKNIIVNDLKDLALELLEYRYNKDLFFYRLTTSPSYENIFFSDTDQVFFDDEGNKVDFEAEEIAGLETLVESLEDTQPAKTFTNGGNTYYLARVKYGQPGGYRETNLVYAGDLVMKAGETVSAALDKIKKMLGQYEYFYDIEGRFVFQKKRYYVNTPIDLNTNDNEDFTPIQEEIAYTFNDLTKFQSFTNNPNINQIKNDFSIWGERKSVSGAAIPIHLRYAVDEKPTRYTSIAVSEDDVKDYNTKYNAELKGQTSISYIANETYEDLGNIIKCDWRELIYQMASDHFKYGFLDDFELRVIQANNGLYPDGMTGYEQYYTDMLGFWRDLYSLENSKELKEEKKKLEEDNQKLLSENNGLEQDIIAARVELAVAYVVLNGYWTQVEVANGLLWAAEQALNVAKSVSIPSWLGFLRDGQKAAIEEAEKVLKAAKKQVESWETAYTNQQKEVDRLYGIPAAKEEKIAQNNAKIAENEQLIRAINQKLKDGLWNKSIHSTPETLNFWFDFLDTEGQVGQYSVKKIGPRAKVINDSSIKAIYFRKTPEVIFVENVESSAYNSGYRYIQVPDIESMFSISAQGRSAKEELDTLLQNHLFTVDSISLQAKPIYYLEPNTKIRINNNETGTFGDYIVSKLTLPLTYNGMMSITATKAVKNIF